MASNHGMGKLKGIEHFCDPNKDQTRRDRFGRLFPELGAAYTLPETLRTIGAVGGEMDGKNNDANTTDIDVGLVFFGQFIDHDITLDIGSSLSANAEPLEIENLRSPSLDLDCIYGVGPEDDPFMYHSDGDFKGVKLLTGAEEVLATPDPLAENDLFRLPKVPGGGRGRAMIGDHRNDENRIISQMQLAMIRFHNKMADDLFPKYRRHELYLEARRLTTWHYQWNIVNEFLPKMCGADVVAKILACGREFFCPNNEEPFIPIEFSVAAYRFGHSMIPQRIVVQAGGSDLQIFGTTLGSGFTALDMPQAVVDWNELFNGSQQAEQLNTLLAGQLLNLKFIPANDERSLATRNLLRGNIFMLPAGEKVAEAMGQTPAAISEVMDKVSAVSKGLITQGAPLWLYILAEAEVHAKDLGSGSVFGEGLGPVGGTIVAETIIGLIELDSRTYLATDRNWSPDQSGPNSVLKMLTY